jgi:peptide/nickel transport system permease protein
MTQTLSAFVVRRLVAALLLVAVVAAGAFALTALSPGDIASDVVIQVGGPEAAKEMRHRLGLDQPLLTQFARWAGGLARMDLGESYEYGTPVAALAGERALNTARLASAALVVALIGWPIGVLTGARPRSALALAVTPVSVALVSCPPIIGTLGLLWLAVTTQWISAASTSVVLPALALGLPLAATIERVQSRAMADALASPDIAAAAARGIPASRVTWRYAARQSLGPVLGIAGVLIGGLFSGSLGVEVVSSWPGLGRLMFGALEARDDTLVAGCALFGAAILAAANLVADVARAVADRRTVVA